jgi:defect-in-organelle-trafficking protein DotA
MGTFYINFSGELFLAILSLSIAGAYIPVFGGLIIVILGLSAPLILAWTGVMLSIGFITAYYIPLLPYMIFTFASIAWLIAVIEAMVAAPIVALGVTHPEGHEAFGKGEPAIMILMNVFLRPSMMIIGFIAAISLSYTGVLLLNTGYSRAVGFIQTPTAPSSSESKSTTIVSFLPQSEIDANMKKAAETLAEPPIYAAGKAVVNTAVNTWDFLKDTQKTSVPIKTDIGNVTGGYTGWAGIFAYFFSVLMYTSIYLIIVQRSFTLITLLPDKVLRWIGGQPESAGQEAAQWGDEAKQKVTDSGDKTAGAEAAMNKQLQGYAQKGIASAKKAMSNTGVKATPGDGGGGE